MIFKGSVNLKQVEKFTVSKSNNLTKVEATGKFDNFFIYENEKIDLFDFDCDQLIIIGEPYLEEKNLKQYIKGLDNYSINLLIDKASNLFGHYLLINVNRKCNKLTVISDKSSSLSFYFQVTRDSIYFSSNILLLKDLWKNNPDIRKESIFEFLGSGNLWGRKTFWEGVERLGPGEVLTAGGYEDYSIKSYWQFEFNNNLSQKPTYRDLNEAIEKDILLLPGGKGLLTLSGGYDSRALLGYLVREAKDFDIITYSFGGKYEGDFDNEIAEYYASKMGYEIKKYEANIKCERVINDINQAIKITGGESDTAIAQDAFLGSEFYSSLGDKYDYMIRGDQVLGLGVYVIDKNSAFWRSYMFNIDQMPYYESILNKNEYKAGKEYIEELRRQISDKVSNFINSSNQLKDYLYWYHRESRLLHNMANYRRNYLPHFAPFLFGNSFEVIKKSSDFQRVNKKFFKNTMRKEFPSLFKDDNQPTKKQPVKSRFELLYEQEEFKDYLVQNLFRTPDPHIEEIFNIEEFECWVQNIIQRDTLVEKTADKSQYNKLKFAFDILKKSNYLTGLITFLFVNMREGKFPAMDYTLLFRIFVLNETLKKY